MNPSPSFDSPLAACDDAIAHYDREIQGYVEEIDRLDRSVRINRSNLAHAQELRQQWIDAQARLRA